MFLNDEEIANLVTGQENDPSIGDPEEELTDALHRLPLRDPMSIASLLNPIEESGVEHMFLNDEEIANLVTGQENNPSIGDPEEEEPAQLTRAEKLKGLSVVISMLNPADPVEHQVNPRVNPHFNPYPISHSSWTNDSNKKII
ncbi:hypothetical protein AXG93_1130s1480 [Marchantia polymorpha subsp. ruderalis]|uniref:Uncharacterized protein n=1 Tax=Marchantia polymorpha subsp. ruderalis TaxID=1480154 RepID=A0A176VIY8_MARPO|nr:hypothetical protein AXG93_1130s1480 [Marchantia polymorpha subsp. ruderalis]